MKIQIIAAIAGCIALSSHNLLAQSLNLDMGDVNVPSPAFGGAAASPGTWNRIGALSASSFTPLLGLSGANAGVFAYGSSDLNPSIPGGADLPGTAGDDELLLDDWLRSVSTVGPWTFYISPLQPGTYDVFVYAPTAASTVGVRVNGGAWQFLTGGWTGAYAQGVTHSFETLTIGTNPVLTIEVNGFSIVSGVQLVRRDTPYESFCLGDGTGPVACPCSNVGGTGRGCGNSVFFSGARLTAVGTASATAAQDTLTLQAQGVPDGFGLYFQGTAQSGPVTFGDGLLCVGGTITRLGIAPSTASLSTFPPSPGSPLISQAGAVGAGDVRQYQLWYRDAASFCTTATFNLSNAVRVTWQ